MFTKMRLEKLELKSFITLDPDQRAVVVAGEIKTGPSVWTKPCCENIVTYTCPITHTCP